MRCFSNNRRHALLNEKGAPMLEYLFLAVVMVVFCIAGVAYFGQQTNRIMENERLVEALD